MERRGWLAVGFFSAVTAALGANTGCGGGDGGGGSGLTRQAACVEYQQTFCQRYAECLPQSFALTYGTLDACNASDAANCAAWTGLDGFAADPQKMAACTAAFKSQACDEAFFSLETPAACEGTYRGTLTPGTACATGAQCDSLRCLVDDIGACGVCAAEVKIGASCAAKNAHCEEGSYCDDTSRTCKKEGVRGDSCANGEICGGTLYCVKGVCADPLAQGAACDLDDDDCDESKELLCEANGKCGKTPLHTASTGEPCGIVKDSFVSCDGTAFCTSDTAQGTCKARLPEGSVCKKDSNGFDDCAPGYTCLAGKCSAGYPVCK